jgi:hypothetical protein
MRKLALRVEDSEINNLYRPNSFYKSETFDEVIVRAGSISKKYLHIACFEWLLLVKPQGRLIITYNPNKEVTFDFLEKSLWWIGRGDYAILEHKTHGAYAKIVLEKTRPMLANLGSIDEWSFGIVTNGERDDWLEQIIQSIRALKIPKYEIIVCGKYHERNEKDFFYIDFNQRSERGWINKKKNLSAQKALYENMCIFHDRLVFDKDWYRGMKRFGNAFAILSCIQIEKSTGENAGDWLTLGGPAGTRWKIARLVPEDWDYYGFIGGQLVIIKKSIWERVLWDETRYWDGVDDADWDLIFRARDMGYISRFNPYATMTALTWRHGKIPLKYNLADGLLPKDMLLRRLMRLGARILSAIPLADKFLQNVTKYVVKTKVYRYFIYH